MTDIFALFDQIKSTSAAAAVPITHLVVGLGNPGEEYAQTRHNAGFLCLDTLAEKVGVKVTNLKFKALTADAVLGGKRVLLMKPQTFMNLSGEAVAAAAAFYKIPPQNVLVICDDVSFDVGHVRIRLQGSHGGHNGLKSIEGQLASQSYTRIKVGVGKKPHPDFNLADWVLGRFSAEDLKTLSEVRASVAEALLLLLEGKPDLAMSRYST
ncbi:MAG: aminoacyl-tRNA hydrolase [Clostridia bacterium]|nr:aminoacyl-tRNA hydrolase [Clostridia bacterium]